MKERLSDILTRMRDYLPPVFDTGPDAALAVVVSGSEPFSVDIDGLSMSIRADSRLAADFKATLEGKTISEIAAEVAATSGYSATVYGFGDKSALRLVDAQGDRTGRLFVFQNPLWAIFKAMAMEMRRAGEAVQEGVRQIVLSGSEGIVANYHGAHYGITRKTSEGDARYGQRILWNVKLPKSNNVALEAVLRYFLGIDCSVIDLGSENTGAMLMNNAATPMHDGFYLYTPSDMPGEPCTFGVLFNEGSPYDLSAENLAFLKELVLAMKASGTRPRVIWRDDTQYMLMNDEVTPMHDAAYPLWDHDHYIEGYLSFFITS